MRIHTIVILFGLIGIQGTAFAEIGLSGVRIVEKEDSVELLGGDGETLIHVDDAVRVPDIGKVARFARNLTPTQSREIQNYLEKTSLNLEKSGDEPEENEEHIDEDGDEWKLIRKRRLHPGAIALFLSHSKSYKSPIIKDYSSISSFTVQLHPVLKLYKIRDARGTSGAVALLFWNKDCARRYENIGESGKGLLAAFGLNFDEGERIARNLFREARLSIPVENEFDRGIREQINARPLFTMDDYVPRPRNEQRAIREFFRRVVRTYLFQDDFWLGPDVWGDLYLYKNGIYQSVDMFALHAVQNRRLARTIALVSFIGGLALVPAIVALPVSLLESIVVTADLVLTVSYLGHAAVMMGEVTKSDNLSIDAEKRRAREFEKVTQALVLRPIRGQTGPAFDPDERSRSIQIRK